MAVKVVARPAHLSWRDFKAVAVIPGSDEEAQVASETTMPAQLRPVMVKGKFRLPNLTVTVVVKSSETIVIRTANKTSDLLEHEQGHYDLLILSARAMAADLEKLEADSPDELQSAINEVQSTHGARATAVDEEYDRQTDHSRNVTQQRRWRKLIDEALGKTGVTAIDGNPL